LELLAKQYAPKQSAPPVTKPPETSTTEPGAEETTTTEEPLKKETEEKKSKPPSAREPLIPTIKYSRFENLKAGMENPQNQSRAWLTVKRIRDQIDAQNEDYMTVLQCRKDITVNAIGNAAVETQHNVKMSNLYYIWSLVLYALVDSKIVRTKDFVTEFIEFCQTTENLPYRDILINSKMVIDLFEIDRQNRIAFMDGKRTIDDIRTQIAKSRQSLPKFLFAIPNIEAPKNIGTTEYADVPFWVWQPNLFYSYYYLSKQLSAENQRIDSDLWICNSKPSKSSPYSLFRTTLPDANKIFNEKIKYPSEKIDSFIRQVDSILAPNNNKSDAVKKAYLNNTLQVEYPRIGSEQEKLEAFKTQFGNSKQLVYYSQWREKILYPLYKAMIQTSFRLPEKLNSSANSIVYALFNNETLDGYSVMEIEDKFEDSSSNQLSLTEIVAGIGHGRFLWLRMYLDSFLFRKSETTAQLLWLEPNRRWKVDADSGNVAFKYQMYQAIPIELFKTYTRWGFQRNFKIDVPIYRTSRDIVSFLYKDNNYNAWKHPTIFKVLANSIPNPFNLTTYTPSYIALFYLFGLEFSPNPAYMFDQWSTQVGLEVNYAPKDIIIPNANLVFDLESSKNYLGKFEPLKYEIPSEIDVNGVLLKSYQSIMDKLNVDPDDEDEEINKLDAERRNDVFWMRRKLLSSDTWFYDIEDVPVVYDPNSIRGETQSDLQTSVDTYWTEMKEKMARTSLSNVEKYITVMIRSNMFDQDISDRYTPHVSYLDESVNIEIEAALNFMKSLNFN
jgi:hypothetical protein